MPYRVEFMNRGEVVQAVELEVEQWEEAIEIAQDGMEKYRANFARILNNDGAEVWSDRHYAERA